jgi:hypothetical protein
MSVQTREKIIKDVRDWIKNPKLEIKDIKMPELNPNDVVIHVKGIIDDNLYRVKKEEG